MSKSINFKFYFTIKIIILLIFSNITYSNYSNAKERGIKDFEKIDLSQDQKPGRYFEDQPDIVETGLINLIGLGQWINYW